VGRGLAVETTMEKALGLKMPFFFAAGESDLCMAMAACVVKKGDCMRIYSSAVEIGRRCAIMPGLSARACPGVARFFVMPDMKRRP
jgi:hypothetical protein